MADKNGALFTAPRGASGLLGDAVPARPGSELIAAPLALPLLKSTSCGQGSQQALEIDNGVFQVGSDGRLVLLQQGTDGTLAFQTRSNLLACPSGDLCIDWSSPAAISDILLFGGGDNALHGANMQATLIWQFNIQGAVISSPAISHGDVYFGGEDGYLYCLSLGGR